MSLTHVSSNSSDQEIPDQFADEKFDEIPLKSITESGLIGDYTILTHIASGTFGHVYSAYGPDGLIVAVKIQKSGPMSDNEVLMMLELDHPNIVQCLEHFTIGNQWNVIVMPLADQESLFDLISDQMTEREMAFIVKHILLGLHHMEQKEVVWLDLKPENILIRNGFPMISDMGLACKYEDLPKQGCYVGSDYFKAPEIRTIGAPHPRSDIWSLGATMYTMITQLMPEQYVAIPRNASLELKHFLIMALTEDPERRPNAYKLLHHPWLRQVQ